MANDTTETKIAVFSHLAGMSAAFPFAAAAAYVQITEGPHWLLLLALTGGVIVAVCAQAATAHWMGRAPKRSKSHE